MASVKLKHTSGNGTILHSPAANPTNDVTLKLPSTTGTAGQVLKVASANHSATNAELEFAAVATSSSWVHAAPVTLPTNASTLTLTGVPDGASHIRYLIRYLSFADTAQTKFRVQKSTTGGSKSIITANYKAYSTYTNAGGVGGGGNTDGMDLWDAYSNAGNSHFGSVDVYRIGTNGSDGTNYFFEHQGFTMNSSGDTQATVQSNGYIELGTNSTDFISGAEFFSNTAENFDNGYINQSYLLS